MRFCAVILIAFLLFGNGSWMMTGALALKTLEERSLSECPEGWDSFGNKCYGLFQETSWPEAERQCRARGSNLVSIHSSEEQRYLESYVQLTESSIWIGMHFLPTQNKYEWTDGSPLDYTYWARGEPNRLNRQEDCVTSDATRQGMWNDDQCSSTHHYICQRKRMCPCQNGGSCNYAAINNKLQCTCIHGFAGLACERKIMCSDYPCRNGGSCTQDGRNSVYRCSCSHRYTGLTCEENGEERRKLRRTEFVQFSLWTQNLVLKLQ